MGSDGKVTCRRWRRVCSSDAPYTVRATRCAMAVSAFSPRPGLLQFRPVPFRVLSYRLAAVADAAVLEHRGLTPVVVAPCQAPCHLGHFLWFQPLHKTHRQQRARADTSRLHIPPDTRSLHGEFQFCQPTAIVKLSRRGKVLHFSVSFQVPSKFLPVNFLYSIIYNVL